MVLYHNASPVLCTPHLPLFICHLFLSRGCLQPSVRCGLWRSLTLLFYEVQALRTGLKKKKKGTVRRWELPASEGYPPARESF